MSTCRSMFVRLRCQRKVNHVGWCWHRIGTVKVVWLRKVYKRKRKEKR